MEFKEEDSLLFESGEKGKIISTLNKNDFALIKTNLDLPNMFEKDGALAFRLRGNVYFCSKKYCLINGKLYKFNKFIKKLNYVLFCNNIIIKYNYKKERKELEKEISIIEEFDLNCKLLDSEKNDDYIVFIMTKIKGSNLSKYLPFSDINKKFNVLFQTLEQLVYLENNGYIYNDLSYTNLLYDNKKVYLIDYGSVDKNKNLHSCRNLNYGGVSILNYFINFLFTIFSDKKTFYYKKFRNFYNILNETNNYSFEELMILKDFILFSQNDIVKYVDIQNYFKKKYTKYYLNYLLTVTKDHVC